MIHPPARCIFIHIPRTAGNSVNRLFGIDWQNHQDLAAYARELPAEIFTDYFKFAIVRNPWERLLSDYNYQRRKSRPKPSKLFLYDDAGRPRNFSQWAEAVLTDPFRYTPDAWGGQVSASLHRWSPQVDWISLGGKIAVDQVIRMEGLRNEFCSLRRRLKLQPFVLPRCNRKFHWHYSHYYDAVTRKRVEDFYASDLVAFGYRFEAAPCRLRWIFSLLRSRRKEEKVTQTGGVLAS